MDGFVRYLWRKACAIEQRLFLLAELSDIRRRRPIPSRAVISAIRQPAAAEDCINFLRFIDPHEKIFLIDVGANVGEWSGTFLDYFPNTRVVAIEPSSEAFSRLSSRYANDPRVSLINAAASDQSGTATLLLAQDSTLNSLESYKEIFKADRADEVQGTESVRLIRIDQEISIADADVRILKCDVQGHEVEAIRGSAGILPLIDIAICELSFVDEYENRSASFSKITRMFEDADLFPVIFQGYGKTISNHRLECDVIYVKPRLFNRLYHSRLVVAA